MKPKYWLLVASALMLIAIVLGAMGAHSLNAVLTEQQLTSFNTAVRYQVYTALSMFVMLMVPRVFQFRASGWSVGLQFIGGLFFSGSIYVLVSTGITSIKSVVGPITPIGGMFLIISWLIFFIHIARQKVSE
ncbi:MAG: DUF423 domain-containing protein [Flavobacteriales bacterium]|nr:DUF423 domain-containing protein [Flavobacteriales bacterium]